MARPLTPKQVAERFGVTVPAVARWADAGLLACFRTPGGQRRFAVEEVERFLRENGDAAESEAAS